MSFRKNIEKIHSLTLTLMDKFTSFIQHILTSGNQVWRSLDFDLVESFSRGTPVIGSNFGNVGSIIIEGKNGFLIDPTSPKDIVQKVNNLYDICDSTYNTAVQLYSPERNYNLLMGIYEKVMSDHSRVL